jgi:hypothetical protein
MRSVLVVYLILPRTKEARRFILNGSGICAALSITI